MKVVLFANGILPNSEINIEPETQIIAADGGARHCLNRGILPQVVIGDFDSLTKAELHQLEKSGSVFLRYSEDKNETDLELALNYALENGVSEITLFGLLGGRWDMSFANILLLASPKYKGIRFQILEANAEMTILRSGETLEFMGIPGETVSVIPLVNDSQGITYKGLTWPLDEGSLAFGSPRGMSNRLSDHSAQIHLKSGVLLIIHSFGNPDDPNLDNKSHPFSG